MWRCLVSAFTRCMNAHEHKPITARTNIYMLYSTESRRLTDSMCSVSTYVKKKNLFFTFLPIILQSIIFPTRFRLNSCSLHFCSLFCVSLCNRLVLSVSFNLLLPLRLASPSSPSPGWEWIRFGKRSEYLLLLSSFSPSNLIICSQLIVLLCILSVVIVMMCPAPTGHLIVAWFKSFTATLGVIRKRITKSKK